MAFLPIFAGFLALLSAFGFLLVGRTIQRRDISPKMRIGQDAFVVWWYALALTSLLGVVMGLPLFHSLQAFLTMTVLALLLLCVGLCGLLFYLVFLFTAKRSLLIPMAIGYAGFFLFLTWWILSGDPTGIEQTPWGPQLEYADPIDQGPIFVIAVLLLVGPQVVASLGYLSLYWKVDDPMLRRRILLVSLSIFAWFGSSLVGTGTAAADSDWWRLASRLIGLVATAVIYYAYTGIQPTKPTDQGRTPAKSDDSLYEAPPRRGVSNVAPALAA